MFKSSRTEVLCALNWEAPPRALSDWARRFLGSICTRPTPIEPLSGATHDPYSQGLVWWFNELAYDANTREVKTRGLPRNDKHGGARENRTPDLLDANETRYQLRYSPLYRKHRLPVTPPRSKTPASYSPAARGKS